MKMTAEFIRDTTWCVDVLDANGEPQASYLVGVPAAANTADAAIALVTEMISADRVDGVV